MAAAEARAVWPRAVNRCFVQEDAKRAPRLACCQSNSTSKQVNSEQPAGGPDGSYYPSSVFMPLNQRLPFATSPDTRWWLLQEPSYDFPRCLSSQALSALDADLEVAKDVTGDPCCKSSSMCMQIDGASAINSISGDIKSNGVMEIMNRAESYEMVEICQAGLCVESKKTNASGLDIDGPWIGHGKNEPWWRTADGSELASFFASKSSDHLENCDLPPPQRVQIRKRPSPSYGSFEHQEAARSSLDWKAHRLKTVSSSWGTVQPWIADGDSPFLHGFTKSHSVHGEGADGIADSDPDKALLLEALCHSQTRVREAEMAAKQARDKAQLLEALCHSQTRAREAEMAAKQALKEKEHVIRLFFRQASRFFAYKQWFQLLHLKATPRNKSNTEKRVSTIVPVLLPWVQCRGKKVRKRSNKGSRSGQGTRKQAKHDVAKYVMVFAVGLGLVGGSIAAWMDRWVDVASLLSHGLF